MSAFQSPLLISRVGAIFLPDEADEVPWAVEAAPLKMRTTNPTHTHFLI